MSSTPTPSRQARTYPLTAFGTSLGTSARPEDLTAANLARYHAHLVAGGRSSTTVRKDRAALNTFLRWLVAHELVPAAQVREALSIRLPRAERSEREAPRALSVAQ